ncbi:MAG: AAA family ATPase [Spirochaetales bacterium]|nr:AAA family ATPase [Spirochaetales bacterium]
MQIYLPRNLSTLLKTDLNANSIVVLLGPRQSGKTTLVQSLWEDKTGFVYKDLERPRDLRQLDDPELFPAPTRAFSNFARICRSPSSRNSHSASGVFQPGFAQTIGRKFGRSLGLPGAEPSFVGRDFRFDDRGAIVLASKALAPGRLSPKFPGRK